MENRRIIKILIFTFGIFFIFPIFTFAYSDTTTHPALTGEIVNLFNHYYPILKISDIDKTAIKKGSTDEDIPPRWMQHFYDPVYNQGLVLGITYQKSKDWAQDTIAQAGVSQDSLASLAINYFSYPDDYSWSRAVYEYVWGNKQKALEALGHTLHLLEDATVPEHTRNDVHLPFFDLGSPYEDWTKQFNDKNFTLSDKIIQENKKPIIYSDLNQYFDNNAIYSNNNFFSKDTTPDKQNKYSQPLIIREKEEVLKNGKNIIFGYGKDKTKDFRLVARLDLFDWQLVDSNYKYFLDDTDNLILTDYWSLLSQQAVLNGAGVVKLFFDAVEKEKNSKVLLSKNTSFLGKIIAAIGNIFSNQKPAPPAEISKSTYDVDETAAPVESQIVPPSSPPAPLLIGEGRTDGEVVNQPTTVVDSASVVRLPMSNISYPGFGGGGAPPPPTALPTTQQESPPSPPAPPPVPTDTSPPDVSFLVLECTPPAGGSLATDGCLLATTTLNILWSSMATDLDYFEFTNNGAISTTTATSTIVAVSDNSINTFSIRAKDTANNWSAPTAKSVEISSMPVVINEVAWAGTGSQTSADEWIELYNRTSKTINLSNWVLFSQTDNKPYINLSGTIASSSYYLIERTDDNTVKEVMANWYGSFGTIEGGGSGLSNNGEVLILGFASTTIDQTPSGSWAGGDSNIYRTMERFDPDVSGTDVNNWGTNNRIIKNGKSADNQDINGTPKTRNSVNYLINKNNDITSNITLTKSKSPYLVNNTWMAVRAGAILTIEPGVTINFYNDAGMIFIQNSKILARGTQTDPITFAGFDNQYWYGVEIQTTNNDSVFDYVNFKQGGKWCNGMGNLMTNLSVKDTSVQITNSVFEKSKVYGLKLSNSNSTISNNIFQNNNQETDPAGYDSGVLVLDGNPTIQNNQFLNNHRGIYLIDSKSILDSNIFQSNANEAVYSVYNLGAMTNNSGSGNGINGIFLYTGSGNLVSANSTATLKSNSLPYVLDSWVNTSVSSTLIIEKNVIVQNGKFNISGNLFVQGENYSDILFNSAAIFLRSGSYSQIKGATFSNNVASFSNPMGTALNYENSPLNLENVRFENNNLAISADQASATQTITAILIEFLNNLATTSPSLW